MEYDGYTILVPLSEIGTVWGLNPYFLLRARGWQTPLRRSLGYWHLRQ
jgi:hypothetical protein